MTWRPPPYPEGSRRPSPGRYWLGAGRVVPDSLFEVAGGILTTRHDLIVEVFLLGQAAIRPERVVEGPWMDLQGFGNAPANVRGAGAGVVFLHGTELVLRWSDEQYGPMDFTLEEVSNARH